ncbi:MAG: hypothetical protein Q7P63_05705 [Verrucomicrobiota bacterium JB022]|nr:hypothetical protein [Verrucomicrobiota bacterium JB022]
MKLSFTHLALLAPVLLAVAFAGCQSKNPQDARVPVNNVYEAAPSLPLHVQRVAVLPVYWEDYQDYTDSYVDEVVLQALRQSARFEVVEIPRETLREWYGRPQLGSQERLPRDLPQRIGDAYGAQGLLVVDLQHFRPYQPMEVSMQAQLVDLLTGETFWSADHTETAGNPVLRKAAASTEARTVEAPVEAFDQRATYSPRRFLGVVSQSLFYTLPHRN